MHFSFFFLTIQTIVINQSEIDFNDTAVLIYLYDIIV